MKTSFLAWGLLLICRVGCGDDGAGGEGGASSSTSGSSKASGSATSGTNASGTNASGTSGSGSSSVTGSFAANTSSATGASSASTGGGMADIDVELDSGDFFADCMPAVPPDPVNGSFVGLFSNAGPDAGTVTIVGAELVFTRGGDTMTWTFEVTPQSFDLQDGADEQITFQKGASTGMGSNPNLGPCAFCGNDATVALNVSFDDGVDLVERSLDLDGAFGCVF